MRLKGANQVIANITLKIYTAKGILPKVAMKAGRLIERRAKENITGKHGHDKHIITGNLRSSIDVKTPIKISEHAYSVPIGTNVHYAPHVEHRDKTGGYLHPALEETKEQVLKLMRSELSGGLNLL